MLPQLYSIWRSKSARGLSTATFLVFGCGILLWLIYGLALRSWPVIVSNSFTLGVVLAILALKLRYDRDQRSGIARKQEECAAMTENLKSNN